MAWYNDVWNWITDSIDSLTGKRQTDLQKQSISETEREARVNEEMSQNQFNENQRQYDETMQMNRESLDYQMSNADRNFDLQQQAYQQQIYENELTRQREDNAMQRQVADLKAAGLSPLMASNGSNASPLNAPEAPQMDTSQVAAAQGSMIQTAREYAELKNMATGQYLTRRQELQNQKNAAREVLAQMYHNNRVQFQNGALALSNIALNLDRNRKYKELVDEQIKYSQDSRVWMNKNGWRNQSPFNAILPYLKDFADKLNIGESINNLANAIKNWRTQGISTSEINDNLSQIDNSTLTEDQLGALYLIASTNKPIEQSYENRQQLNKLYAALPDIHDELNELEFYELMTSSTKVGSKQRSDFMHKWFPELFK